MRLGSKTQCSLYPGMKTRK
jgi:hypothetical protein